MGKVSSDKGIYFSELYLDNVKCFKQPVTLNFTDKETGRWKQWTVILGDNGLGKTTILQCLASLEICYHDSDPDSFDGHFAFSPIQMKLGILEEYAAIQAELYYSFDLSKYKAAKVLVTDYILNKNYDLTTKDNIDLSIKSNGMHVHYGGKFFLHTNRRENFVIFSYGATRIMSIASLSGSLWKKNAETLFSSEAKLINAEEWLLQLDYAASKESDVKDYALSKREKVRQILIDILPDVTDIRFSVPTKESLKSNIEFLSSFGWIKIDQLSLGYKTMVAWIVDLAARLFEKYPDSDNPLAEPSVVLVDEIDLHLHPKWQRTIFEYLSDKFPATQFIVTAHSPLIVQAAPEDVNLVVLRKEGDHVIIDQNIENVRQWRIDQILTSDLFGIGSARNPEIEEWLEERRKLLQKNGLTDSERQRLKILNDKAHGLPTAESPEDIEAMEIIREAADYLKNNGN